VAKVRVYELAKELGLDSKELLTKLQEVGEFVKSASSTVEAPVVRKLMEKFPDMKPAESAPVKKAAAKKAVPKKPEQHRRRLMLPSHNLMRAPAINSVSQLDRPPLLRQFHVL